MSELTPSEFGDGPTVEIHRELCESAEQDGVECQVDDLSVHHGPDEILEPTSDALVEDEYRVGTKSQ